MSQYPYEAMAYVTDDDGNERALEVFIARTGEGAAAASRRLLRGEPTGHDLRIYIPDTEEAIDAYRARMHDDGDGDLLDAREAVSNLWEACKATLDRLGKVIDIGLVLREDEKRRIAKESLADLRSVADQLKPTRYDTGRDHAEFVDLLYRKARENATEDQS